MLKIEEKEQPDILQSHIQKQLVTYLKKNNRDPVFIQSMDLSNGHCSGFAKLWLYASWLIAQPKRKSTDEPKKRDDMEWLLLAYHMISLWDGNRPLSPTETGNFERIITFIEFFQNHRKYLPETSFDSLDQLLLDTRNTEFRQEYYYAAHFEFPELYAFLTKIIPTNKLVLISSIKHTVALIKRENGFEFYDSNNPKGAITFIKKNICALPKEIFRAFSMLISGAIEFSIWGTEEKPTHAYPHPIEYLLAKHTDPFKKDSRGRDLFTLTARSHGGEKIINPESTHSLTQAILKKHSLAITPKMNEIIATAISQKKYANAVRFALALIQFSKCANPVFLKAIESIETIPTLIYHLIEKNCLQQLLNLANAQLLSEEILREIDLTSLEKYYSFIEDLRDEYKILTPEIKKVLRKNAFYLIDIYEATVDGDGDGEEIAQAFFKNPAPTEYEEKHLEQTISYLIKLEFASLHEQPAQILGEQPNSVKMTHLVTRLGNLPHHSFAQCLLGRIYAGDIWGKVDKFYDLSKAESHLKQIKEGTIHYPLAFKCLQQIKAAAPPSKSSGHPSSFFPAVVEEKRGADSESTDVVQEKKESDSESASTPPPS